jgi:membrane protease YdiL (CAAX protease family)
MQNLLQSIAPEDVSPALLILGAFVSIILIAGVICDIIILIRLRRRPVNIPDMTARLLTTQWTLTDAGTVLLAIAVVAAFFALYAMFLRFSGFAVTTEYTEAVSTLVETLSYQIVALATIVGIMNSKGLSWREAFGIERARLATNIRLGAFFYLATMPIFVFVSLIYDVVLNFFGFSVEQQEILSILINPSLPCWLQITLMLLAIAAAPMIEEFLFRGIVMPAVTRRYSLPVAVCLVSFAFAVIHFHAAALLPLFVIAVAFSSGYLYSGSIIVPITMHMFFNGVTVVIYLMSKDAPIDTLGFLHLW